MKQSEDIEPFIQVFDNGFNEYLDQNENGIRDLIERMTDGFRMEEWNK